MPSDLPYEVWVGLWAARDRASRERAEGLAAAVGTILGRG